MTKPLSHRELAIANDVLARVELLVLVAVAEVKRAKELLVLIDPAVTDSLPADLQKLELAALSANEESGHFAENARRQTAFGELATPQAVLQMLAFARSGRLQ